MPSIYTISNKRLLELGVSREQARGILPQDLITEFYMSGNLRNWSHFQKLRLDSHAQEEVQIIARQLDEILLECFPYSYTKLKE
jgi:thymidylate synthase (FAD)